jgi:sulfatase modifying factor 1
MVGWRSWAICTAAPKKSVSASFSMSKERDIMFSSGASFRKVPLSAAILMAVALSGCIIGGKEDKPLGSEIENELGARIYLADGTPAAGATVKVYPVNQSPVAGLPKSSRALGPVFATRTDAKGRYALDSLPRGEYNILSDKDGEVAYQDSVFIAGTKASILSDTLRDPGSIAGRIVMQPQDDLRSATVELLGTNVFVNVDAEGGFTLGGLAAGLYRARAVTTAEGYTPTYFPVQVASGHEDSLPAPIILTYTGIPVVENIEASFDTLRGEVRLSWNSVKYANLQQYVVYAGSAGSLFDLQVVGTTRDTGFTFHPSDLNPGYPYAISGRMEFRVAVRNKSLQTGLTYSSVELDIVPASEVATQIAITPLGTKDGQASIHDTVRFALACQNPTRKNVRIVWQVSGAGAVREVRTEGQSGTDTLVYRWDEPGHPSVTATVTDEAGSEWSGMSSLYVVTDAPKPLPWPNKHLDGFPGDTLRAHAGDTDLFGRILSWEWDFGAQGDFARSSGPDTFLVIPSGASDYPVAVRVTDDDGNSPVDTFYVTAVSSYKMVELPAGDFLRGDGKRVPVGKFRIMDREVERALYSALMGDDHSSLLTKGPVNFVSIPAAMEFCNKLSRKEGRPNAYDMENILRAPKKGGYRLPTAAEWEYAARAGNEDLYWQKLDYEELDKTTWFYDNSYVKLHPVAEKLPNAFGLYDMDGNVSEWIDLFDSNGLTLKEGAICMGSNFRTDYFGSLDYKTGWRSVRGYIGNYDLDVGFRVVLEE